MPGFVACKLPHGLSINHNGQTINLIGANSDYDPSRSASNPPSNGMASNSANMESGYGITQLNDDQVAAFNDWKDRVTFQVSKDGSLDKNAKLAEPNAAIENGLLIGPFKSDADARSEVRKAALKYDPFLTGMDGDREMKEALAATGKDLVPEKGVSEKNKG